MPLSLQVSMFFSVCFWLSVFFFVLATLAIESKINIYKEAEFTPPHSRQEY